VSRWPLTGLLTALVAACAPGAVMDEPVPRPPTTATVVADGRIAFLHDPGASAVVLALVFPGSGWELPGTEGLTLLTAETLLETARPELARLEATVAVYCDRAAFTVTLVSPVDRADDAIGLLVDALFEPRPTTAALDSARTRLRDVLSLDHANPAWQARLAARQALHGDGLAPSPWSGPACGVPEILPSFDLRHVRAGAYRFAPRMARAALIGPEGPRALHEHVRARLPRNDGPPPLPAPRHTGAARRYVERNTVTAWTSLAFPFGPDGDAAALRGLAALVEDAFGPSVERPDVFDIGHELERHGGGGALIVHVVTTPEAAAGYADAMEGWVSGLAVTGDGGSWERLAARYRGERLLERERPETRAAAMAMALALGRDPGAGWPETELTSERVRAAAATLRRPARSVVGPRAARPAAP
jgi:predicted Zn-dependent peptidase